MADFYTNKLGDNLIVAKSKTILSPAAGTYNLIRIPKFALVKNVWLFVETAGSSDTVSVGFVGNGEAANASYFLPTLTAEATVAGMKIPGNGTSTGKSAKYFNAASGAITLTVGTTQTTGKFYVFCEYSIVI